MVQEGRLGQRVHPAAGPTGQAVEARDAPQQLKKLQPPSNQNWLGPSCLLGRRLVTLPWGKLDYCLSSWEVWFYSQAKAPFGCATRLSCSSPQDPGFASK